MTILKAGMGVLSKTGRFFITVVILLSACLYIRCSIYSFQETSPFQGSHLYNPYGGNSSGSWSKANFHTHAIAWGRITNGHQTPEEIIDVYKNLGYDILSISNYHNIKEVTGSAMKSIPVYEHGYNIFKTHRLVFEPSRVNFFDLPFFQTTNMKQSVINALANESTCIALNHPVKRNGYPDKDLEKLSGYDLMEVLNHSANSAVKWDVVLSAGKPVWCVGNDDMHNAEKESEVGVCWAMLYDVRDSADITEKLKKGNAYIVKGKKGVSGNALKSLVVKADTMVVKLARPAQTVRFIGQQGVVRQTAAQQDSVAYVFRADDTYIRTEIIDGDDMIYLNPVIRYDGVETPSNYGTATVNIIATMLYRVLVLLISGGVLLLLYRRSFYRLLAALGKIRYRGRRLSWDA